MIILCIGGPGILKLERMSSERRQSLGRTIGLDSILQHVLKLDGVGGKLSDPVRQLVRCHLVLIHQPTENTLAHLLLLNLKLLCCIKSNQGIANSVIPWILSINIVPHALYAISSQFF